MSKDPGFSGFIAITHKGAVVSLLGPDGPVYCATLEVDLEHNHSVPCAEVVPQGSGSSPYRIETVIPKREYILANQEIDANSGAMIDAAFEDVAPLTRTAVPRDIKVGDEVLYRDETGWHSETALVADIRYRFEHLIRDNQGNVFSVVLDRDILNGAHGEEKATPKTRKGGRKRRVRATTSGTPETAPATEPAGETA